jgi:hypothetical protein
VAQPSWLWAERASCPLKKTLPNIQIERAVKLHHFFRRTATDWPRLPNDFMHMPFSHRISSGIGM